MTDNEIIKALECCNDGWNCKSCAFDDEGKSMSKCTSELAKAALDLIYRQQEEIVRLSNFVTEERCREIAKEYFQPIAKQTRDGIIKEFADRAVIELTANYSDEYCHWIDDTIDSLVKEMAGETDDR